MTAVVGGELKNKKWISDAKVLAAAKRLKPEAEVVYRAREADGKLWLKEIKPAPQQREEKPTASAGQESDEKTEDRPRRGGRRRN